MRARRIGQRRVRVERGGEARQRLLFFTGFEERLSAAEERRHICRIRGECPRKPVGRGLEVLSRERHVAETRFRWIEIGRVLERGAEPAFCLPQIPGLERVPRDPVRGCGRRALERLRNRREDERGIARNGWRRNRLGRTGRDRASCKGCKEKQDPALPCLPSFVLRPWSFEERRTKNEARRD